MMNSRLKSTNLTSSEFWQRFWEERNFPLKVDLSFSNDKTIASIFSKYLDRDIEFEAFEVGCAPGKWLVYLSENYKCSVSGCEFEASAAAVTIDNLKRNHSRIRNIIYGDFLELRSDTKYDLVFSLGFIEHFENASIVFEKHLDLLKDGGLLILGIPNFRGLNYIFQRIIDGRSDDPLLPKHNLKIMKKTYFSRNGKLCGLKTQFVGFVGGFEPAIFDISKFTKLELLFFRVTSKIFSSRVARDLSLPFYSSYIMAVFRK